MSDVEKKKKALQVENSKHLLYKIYLYMTDSPEG